MSLRRRVLVRTGSAGRSRAIVRQLEAEGFDARGDGGVDDEGLLAVVVAGELDDEEMKGLEVGLGEDRISRYLLHDEQPSSRSGWVALDARRPALLVRALLHDALDATATACHESEARVRSLIDAVGSLVVCLDLSGAITEWNPAAEKLWGRGREDVLGEIFATTCIGHRERDAVLDAIEHARLREDLPPVGVSVETAVSSEPRSVQWHFTALVGPGGEVTGVLAIGRDVTEQERAEHELRLSREELRLLARHLSSVREAERSDIGREIHDQLGQSLTALKLHLSWFEGRDAEVPPDIADWTERMGRMIDGTLEAVRRISRNLRPHVLEDLGFLAAVRWQAEEFTKRFGIPCRLECEVSDVDLSSTSSTQLFRILQESLTNVARHAEASRVSVTVGEEADRVVLTVEDDGRGFDRSRIGVSTSVGLVGMRERALICGGEVDVTPGTKGGTRVEARFPLADAGWGG